MLSAARRLTSAHRLLRSTAPSLSQNVRFLSVSDAEIDKRLRDDIKNLGRAVGDCVREEDQAAFESVEKLRKLGRHWRPSDEASFTEMVEAVQAYSPQHLMRLAKSFAHFLALSNSAENHHRIRRLRNALDAAQSPYGLWPKKDSCGGCVRQLITEHGIAREEVFRALCSQSVDVVLTAHPTEVNRRTMLRKHLKIREYLETLDRPDLSLYERRRVQEEMHAEVRSIWASDSLRRQKPTPLDESKFGLAIVENTLWHAVPLFMRKLDDILRHELSTGTDKITLDGEKERSSFALPLSAAPVRFSSWMGGDRDGNPNVTPETTLQVSLLSRWMAATLYRENLHELRAALSVQTCNEEIRERVAASLKTHKYAQTQSQVHTGIHAQPNEPYREFLRELDAKLQATIEWTNRGVEGLRESESGAASAVCPGVPAAPPEGVLLRKDELLEPLLAVHRSLCECGLQEIADAELTDMIRRVQTFGATLLRLDLRQESTRHSEALTAVTERLGLGRYEAWTECERVDWLSRELVSNRPLLPRCVDWTRSGFSPSVIDTLRTFQVAAALPEESLGAYVISMCRNASDVLAVALLLKDARSGLESGNQGHTSFDPAKAQDVVHDKTLRIVPLFETLDDLQRSADVLHSLFSVPAYRACIHNAQEVMVGYSDSAKDAGRLAASWAQYQAQIAMARVADSHGVHLTFFHGKGGTVGRGGNPALFDAILAHPPQTIRGRFRVTEQGEMITQNLGQVAVAERSLDLLTAGVLVERFSPHPPLREEWIAAMERLSETSCAVYRSVVRDDPRFVPYFRTATPEMELSKLNVGSRPQKRHVQGGVESLRAIPWNFAWTQTRLNLPTWLGVGEAFAQEMARDPELLRTMYAQWPWFQTLVDLLEMIVVKSESKIAENYDKQLVSDPSALVLGRELRERLARTSDSVLAVSQHAQLQVNNPVLLRSLAVRNPYIDPLNVIQAEILKRLRSAEETSAAKVVMSEEDRNTLQDALLITINGIANGMRNSGEVTDHCLRGSCLSLRGFLCDAKNVTRTSMQQP